MREGVPLILIATPKFAQKALLLGVASRPKRVNSANSLTTLPERERELECNKSYRIRREEEEERPQGHH